VQVEGVKSTTPKVNSIPPMAPISDDRGNRGAATLGRIPDLTVQHCITDNLEPEFAFNQYGQKPIVRIIADRRQNRVEGVQRSLVNDGFTTHDGLTAFEAREQGAGSSGVRVFEFFDSFPKPVQLRLELSGCSLQLEFLGRRFRQTIRRLPSIHPLPTRQSGRPETVAPPVAASEATLSTPHAVSRKTLPERGPAIPESSTGQRPMTHRSGSISSWHGDALLSAFVLPRSATVLDFQMMGRAFTHHRNAAGGATFVKTRYALFVRNSVPTFGTDTESADAQSSTLSAAAAAALAAPTEPSVRLHSLTSSLASAFFRHGQSPSR
jgi:hypothetical protein